MALLAVVPVVMIVDYRGSVSVGLFLGPGKFAFLYPAMNSIDSHQGLAMGQTQVGAALALQKLIVGEQGC